jgi:hypothetical protein
LKKINVDIKNGQFITYPFKEVLSSIKGYVSKCYYKKVGNSNQFKVVIINNDIEYTINCITNNVTYQSMVTTLIESSGKVNLELKHFEGEYPYYLIVNKNIT